jgi:hypothetical protein
VSRGDLRGRCTALRGQESDQLAHGLAVRLDGLGRLVLGPQVSGKGSRQSVEVAYAVHGSPSLLRACALGARDWVTTRARSGSVPGQAPEKTGSSAARQRTCFGSRRSRVQIPPPRPTVGVDTLRTRPRSDNLESLCGCSSMVEPQISNLLTRVRFPSPARSEVDPNWWTTF